MNRPSGPTSGDLSDETLAAWVTAAAFEYDVPDAAAERVLVAAGERASSEHGLRTDGHLDRALSADVFSGGTKISAGIDRLSDALKIIGMISLDP